LHHKMKKCDVFHRKHDDNYLLGRRQRDNRSIILVKKSIETTLTPQSNF